MRYRCHFYIVKSDKNIFNEVIILKKDVIQNNGLKTNSRMIPTDYIVEKQILFLYKNAANLVYGEDLNYFTFLEKYSFNSEIIYPVKPH